MSALESAKFEIKEKRKEFNIQDMMYFGLCGNNKAKEKREQLGKILRIGYCNTSQLLTRLNNYGITKEEFIKALEIIDKENENGKK